MTNTASFHLRMLYPALLASFVGIIILKKPHIIKRAIRAWFLYFLLMISLAYIGEEIFYEQLKIIWNYAAFIVFLIPILVFAGKDFDIHYFYKRIFQYALILCFFYILDSIVFSGNVLVPCSFLWGWLESTFYHIIRYPGEFHRKYPPGLYILILTIYPVCRYYKLKIWHYIVILGALACTQTFTFITGIIVTFVLFQPNKKRVAALFVVGIIGLISLYFIDGTLPYNRDKTESFFRIKSSVDQIIDLKEVQDDEDFSKTGSGRIAQAIPKLDLLYELNKEWTGFGFLSQGGTTVKKYVIENDYYEDEEEAIEVATNIEITMLQVLITIGYIGLLAHLCFYIYIYYLERKLRYSSYLLSVLIAFAWLGIGGFEGWITSASNALIALAFAAVYLENRPNIDDANPIYKTLREKAMKESQIS